jgi:hypothetical protein
MEQFISKGILISPAISTKDCSSTTNFVWVLIDDFWQNAHLASSSFRSNPPGSIVDCYILKNNIICGLTNIAKPQIVLFAFETLEELKQWAGER